MPWKRMDLDEARMRFVIRAVSGRERMTALCREFGISPPTGYLWRRRYCENTSLGDLAEQSRRPRAVRGARPLGKKIGWWARGSRRAGARRSCACCCALANQYVRVERFDGKLLVNYCSMYIREIDLARERTRPLVVERSAAGETVAVALQAHCAVSPEEKQSPG